MILENLFQIFPALPEEDLHKISLQYNFNVVEILNALEDSFPKEENYQPKNEEEEVNIRQVQKN